jgi:hypothetical protein
MQQNKPMTRINYNAIIDIFNDDSDSDSTNYNSDSDHSNNENTGDQPYTYTTSYGLNSTILQTYGEYGSETFSKTSECKHYNNMCNILCPECPDTANIYPCHKCHNENVNPNTNEKHFLKSDTIQHIQCVKCNHKQLFGNQCVNCKVLFAIYMCVECKLLNNKGLCDDYYHCDKCKCCYNGNKKEYQHCDKCNICMRKIDILTHMCRKNNDWDIILKPKFIWT